jgi:hypothetical protein
MFPWGLFRFSERNIVRDLIGPTPESMVFLYCTCSQRELYRETLRLTSLNQPIPRQGLRVRNCQTGETREISARDAANVLMLLGADIAEQDPFFDMHLAMSLVRLAAPHLPNKPHIISRLEDAGFFTLSREQHQVIKHVLFLPLSMYICCTALALYRVST